MNDDFVESSDTIFRDVITLALIGILAIIIILLAHVNPKGKKAENDIRSPGSVIAEIVWDKDRKEDIDLWVLAPGDVPVGYSNKGGLVFNLLRDDLGHVSDPSPINMETSYSRGAPAGEYVFNAHLFRQYNKIPIEVDATIKYKENKDKSAQVILHRKIILNTKGEEQTIARFKLDNKGKVKPGSVNTIQKSIRSASFGRER